MPWRRLCRYEGSIEHNTSMRTPVRHAFTLIELLVVIAIISVLAGVLIPTTAAALKRSRYVKCGNNLKQLGTGIKAWQVDNGGRDDQWPGYLVELFAPGSPYVDAPRKILICPEDENKGRGHSGRYHGGHWDNFEHLLEREREHPEFGHPVSYFYEVSNSEQFKSSGQTVADGFGHFGPMRDYYKERFGHPLPTPTTWAEYKRQQQRFGNPINGDEDSATVWGPWAKSNFPIIRCYHHENWEGNNSDADKIMVLNVSWNGEVFESPPYWEHYFNPNISLPRN